MMLDRPNHRQAARQRQRRCRKRRRQGIALLRVEALQKAGRPTVEDGLRRAQVEVAVSRILRDWVERWLGQDQITRGLPGDMRPATLRPMRPLVPEDLYRNGHARREHAITPLVRAALAIRSAMDGRPTSAI